MLLICRFSIKAKQKTKQNNFNGRSDLANLFLSEQSLQLIAQVTKVRGARSNVLSWCGILNFAKGQIDHSF